MLRGQRKRNTQWQKHRGGHRQTDKRRRRSKYPQSKCRCWVMLPWQPVFPDIMQGEWYWRKSHYDHRGKVGGWGLRILSQGHSERRVILMMILMGSNGGSDRHRPTHPSLKSLWKLTHTHKRARTHTHTYTIARTIKHTHTCTRMNGTWTSFYCWQTHATSF